MPPTDDDSTLRNLFGTIPPDEWLARARSREFAYWAETNRFCGRCGAPLAHHANPAENAMCCPKCGLLSYPKITPAVIVLVKKGDQILLQRNTHYKMPHWSLVAGFLDPAETFEEAVRREIREESALEVSHIRYFDSQIWPFPSNLMVGFVADWASGEPTPDGEEVVESGWFGRANLPSLPGRISIARRLIDAWLDGRV
ncbi:MAG: NAD(+) diphosphatase [Kiritimatiellia bacterium]